MKIMFKYLFMALIIAAFVSSANAVSFTFEQTSYSYVGTSEFPYQYEYELTYSDLLPAEAPINDLHLNWPVYYGGYLEVNPPQGWRIASYGFYGPNYEANPGNDFTNVSGSLGGFTIYGKLPTLVNGSAYLTQDGGQVGTDIVVMLPEAPEPATLSLLAVGALALLKRRRL